MTNENKQSKKNKIIKEEAKEIKSPNWIDKDKFKGILAITDSNELNYKNEIGEFKYIDIKDLVNNVRNNTISEIDARKDLNTLDKIKNAEIIKYKKCTPGHKELLNSLDNLLDMILTDITLESESQENENEKVEIKKEEHEDYENEYEDDDETMSQNEIKEKKDYLDKIIDKSKPFKDQIKSFKKVENLKGYWRFKKFGDKKLKFKLKVAHLSKIIDEKLFEQIFGHTFIKLANKLINTKNKE